MSIMVPYVQEVVSHFTHFGHTVCGGGLEDAISKNNITSQIACMSLNNIILCVQEVVAHFI